MKILTLFRGSPACGKSTFIEENNLTPYTLSADNIRLMLQSPEMGVEGRFGISQSNNKKVWKLLLNTLEDRMKRGEFVVVDSTNSTTQEFQKYTALAKTYRYRIICVDMTDVSQEECLKRNEAREVHKRVPNHVIMKMYERFKTQPIPASITVVKPSEYLGAITINPINLSDWNKIHHIGDIHGCNTALQEYLGNNLKRDEFYIFHGDFIDRGIENAEVIKFLLSIMKEPNVIFLSGNHEDHLWKYSKDLRTPSKEFEQYTRPQLDEAGIDKKELRCLYRLIRQMAYYKYHDKYVFASHGGISYIPRIISVISTEQLIKGVGSYGDMEKVNETFNNKMPKDFYQIHGHRNVNNAPIQVNDRCYCLEGQVEFGGCLRIVTLDETGFTPIEIKNTVFKKKQKIESIHTLENKEIIEQLRNNKYIKEKKMEHISSFNFTSKAFNKGIWDEQTLRARGLFFNTNTGDIVIRSYDKFFNVEERTETQLSNLKHNMKFPAKAYVKYNGYLGLLGYDKEADEILVASKSDLNSAHARWFQSILYLVFDRKKVDFIKEYMQDNNCTLVWEVIDPINDPHMIKYDKPNIVLLSIVYNKLEFEEASFMELQRVANLLGVDFKQVATTFENWTEFEEWYKEVTKDEYKYKGQYIEGFVIKDSNKFMTKIKGRYYSFWKRMRSIKDEVARKGNSDRIEMLKTPLAIDFYRWCKVQTQETLRKDIIQTREQYYSDIGEIGI